MRALRGKAWQLLAATAAASGAIVAPSSAATVAVGDGQLTVATTISGRNVVDVSPFGMAYRVYDSLAPVAAGTGCVGVSPNEAICGGEIMSVRINGSDGDDLLGLWDISVPVTASGGAGDDLIETGANADRIDSGSGQDAVVGGAGDDTINGGDGNDVLEGAAGDDAIAGDAGDDVVEGGPDDDTQLFGGGGDDLVDGGAGDDTLHGEDGDDALVARQGEDVINTGEGNDRVYQTSRSVRRLTCSHRRSGRRGSRSARCRVLGASRPSPQVWPPITGTQALGRSAAATFPVYVRDPADPERLSVAVTAKHRRRAWVCVTLTDVDGGFLQRFGKKTWIPSSTFSHPRPPSHSHYGEGRLTKHQCHRRP